MLSKPHTVQVQPAAQEKIRGVMQAVEFGAAVSVDGQLTPGQAGQHFDEKTGVSLKSPHLFLCEADDGASFAYGYRVLDGRGRKFAVGANPKIWDASPLNSHATILLDFLEYS